MSQELVAQDNTAALALVERAIERLEPHGATTCLVHALDFWANELIDLGRSREAKQGLERALAVCDAMGDDELFYGTSATLAWHLAHLGDLDGALQRLDAAHARLSATSEPRREAYMAMMHTDVLIQHRRPVDEVVQAAQRALDIGREMELDFHMLTLVRANVAEAWLNSGRTRQAARALEGISPGADYDHWPIRWMSALVAIADGRLDEGLDTLTGLEVGTVPQNQLELARWIAMAHLWKGDPARAWTGLVRAIEKELGSPTVVDACLAFTAAARAAADLATLGARGRVTDGLASTLADLRVRAVVDPLGPAPAPILRRAATATWDAELARTDCRDTVGQWTLAATEWETLRSPHDAAYCRWRAAQVALRDGHGTLAARLLRRAAADAREHVPLTVRPSPAPQEAPHERPPPPGPATRTPPGPQRRAPRAAPPGRLAQPAHPRRRGRLHAHHRLGSLLDRHPPPRWGTLELVVEALDGDTVAFHDLWLAASTPGPVSGTAGTAGPRIAGRRAEMAAVRRHLETGTGLMLVTGEAGIGKTRLVTTAAETVDGFVARGSCLPRRCGRCRSCRWSTSCSRRWSPRTAGG